MEVKWRYQSNLRTKFNFSGTKFNHKMSKSSFQSFVKKKIQQQQSSLNHQLGSGSETTSYPGSSLARYHSMWARIILAALTTVAFTPPAAAAFTGTFPWARVPTMMQTGFPGRFTRSSNMTGNGRLDAAVVRFIAENYDIIVSNDLLPGKPGCLEPKHKELADRIAAINPTAKYLMYMANNIHHGSLVPPTGKQDSNYECGLDNFKLEWVATLDDGTPITDKGKYYMHNLSNPDCRAWWLNTVTNSTMGENVHGVFADNGKPPSLHFFVLFCSLCCF